MPSTPRTSGSNKPVSIMMLEVQHREQQQRGGRRKLGDPIDRHAAKVGAVPRQQAENQRDQDQRDQRESRRVMISTMNVTTNQVAKKHQHRELSARGTVKVRGVSEPGLRTSGGCLQRCPLTVASAGLRFSAAIFTASSL